MIRLPDYNVDAFRYFVHWLYTKSLTGYHNSGINDENLKTNRLARVSADLTWSYQDSIENSISAKSARATEGKALVRCFPLAQLVGLYILADQLEVPDLKDQIISKIIHVYCKTENSRSYYWSQSSKPIGAKDADTVIAINLAYHYLKDGFLKPLLVRLYVDNVRKEHNSNTLKYNSEFLVNVIQENCRRADSASSVPRLKSCEWHEHDGGLCSILKGDNEEEESNDCFPIREDSPAGLSFPSDLFPSSVSFPSGRSNTSSSIPNSPAEDSVMEVSASCNLGIRFVHCPP